MQIDQPIWFEMKGQKTYGIVKQVLPDKGGVVAQSIIDGMEVMVKVPNPHKVRDPKEQEQVFKMFGYEAVHAGADKSEGKKAATKPAEVIQPKEVKPVDPETMFTEDDIKWLQHVQHFGTFIHPNSEPPKKETTDPEPPKAA